MKRLDGKPATGASAPTRRTIRSTWRPRVAGGLVASLVLSVLGVPLGTSHSSASHETPPDTEITYGPPEVSADIDPTFEFVSSETAATFECSVDAEPFSACEAPFTIDAVGDGMHTFTVRATDADGFVDETPAERGFTVDSAHTPGGTIVYPTAPISESQQNPYDLYVVNPDGSNVERLTDSPQSDDFPAFSPDGQRIAWARDGDLWVMDNDGTDAEPVTSGADTDSEPAWSPDGSRLAFTSDRDGDSDLWVVDLDTGVVTQLIDDPGVDSAPTFSPDGTHLAFTSDRDGARHVYVAHADGTGPVKVTGSLESAFAAAFTRDGTKLAVIGVDEVDTQLRLVDVASPHRRRDLTSSPFSLGVVFSGVSHPAVFSPDGSQVGFNARLEEEFECTNRFTGEITTCLRVEDGFFVADADGSRPVRVTAGFTPLLRAPDWGPDDLVAPQTSITDGPTGPTNEPGPTFSFASSEEDSTFECRVDEEAFAPCSSPHTTASLAEGSHVFEVRATDPGGNTDSTPAAAAFSVDLSGPDTTITDGPTGPTNDETPTFSFTSSEEGSTFECRVDDDAFAPCSTPHTAPILVDGSHGFEVRATDPAGNTDDSPAAAIFTVDTTAPDTEITSGPPASTNGQTATFSFTSSEQGSTFECRVDGEAFASCSSPHTTATLAEGSHVFEVRATDPVGNTDLTPASATFTVDLSGPDTTITDGPTGPTNDSTPTFSFTSSEEGSTFECRVDEEAFASCTSPHTTATLIEGVHVFEVRATDPSGNTDDSPGTAAFTVDLSGPDTSIDDGPENWTLFPQLPTESTSDTTPTFRFSSPDETATFECSLDSASYAPCASPHTVGPLTADGFHSFRVRAVDPAGNSDPTPPTAGFLLDTSVPDTFLLFGSSATTDPSPTFGFRSDDPNATFECRVDNGAFAACVHPTTVAPVAPGSHQFWVRAVDSAGNVDPTPATKAFTVAAVAPIPGGGAILANHPRPSPAEDQLLIMSADGAATPQWSTGGDYGPGSLSPDGTKAVAARNGDLYVVDIAGFPRQLEGSGATDATPVFSPDGNQIAFASRAGSGPWSIAIVNIDGSGFRHLLPGLEDGFNELEPAFSPDGTHIAFTSDRDGVFKIYTVFVDGTGLRKITNGSEPDFAPTFSPTGDHLAFSRQFPFGSQGTVNDLYLVDLVDKQSRALTAFRESTAFIGDAEHPAFSPDGTRIAVSSLGKIHAVDVDDKDMSLLSDPELRLANPHWGLDTLPPDSRITDGPSVTNDPTPTFQFTSNEPGSTFECRIDSGAWFSCASPYTTPTLSHGSHQFAVRATDAAGNQEAQPSVTLFQIDRNPPQTTITSGPSGVTSDVHPTFGFTSSENPSTFTCELEDLLGPVPVPCSSPVTGGPLADGRHVFRVWATDAVGNTDPTPASRDFVVEGGLIVFEESGLIKVMDANGTNLRTVVAGTLGDISPTGGLIVYRQQANSKSRVVVRDLNTLSVLALVDDNRYDDHNPSFSPDGQSVVFLRTLRGASASTAVWVVGIDGTGLRQLTPENSRSFHSSPVFSADGSTIAFSGIHDGSCGIFFMDADGTDVRRWKAQTSPNCSPRVAFSPDGSSIAFNRGGFEIVVGPISDPSAGVVVATGSDPTFSPDGKRLLYDHASPQYLELESGQVHRYTGVTAARTLNPGWANDGVQPDTTITSGPSGQTSDSTPTFGFVSNKPASTFQCRVDSGAWLVCGSPVTVASLSDGTHTFEVRATDPVGNRDATPAKRKFTVGKGSITPPPCQGRRC